eukprot:TRINITY_DN112233_c0_g1_i1.p1 TRINITY_DN112233_c0_g1~~TRINITY_DN112233_c0_g1_i1.p1  ORF type:complete len:261 (-),score=41.96 TRINITY_DN112233_c0_g1_i1:150-869(-)
MAAVLVPQSRRTEYAFYRHKYPETWSRLTRAMDQDADHKAKIVAKLEAKRGETGGLRSSSGLKSASASSGVMREHSRSQPQLGAEDLLAMSGEDMARYLDGRVLDCLRQRRQGGSKSLRKSRSGPADAGSAAPDPTATSRFVRKDRNAGGRFFVKNMAWERAAVLGGDGRLVPEAVDAAAQPRKELPEFYRQLVQREKDDRHPLSIKVQEFRTAGGCFNLDTGYLERPNAADPSFFGGC